MAPTHLELSHSFPDQPGGIRIKGPRETFLSAGALASRARNERSGHRAGRRSGLRGKRGSAVALIPRFFRQRSLGGRGSKSGGTGLATKRL